MSRLIWKIKLTAGILGILFGVVLVVVSLIELYALISYAP